jgi:hypothetical protein
MSSGKYCLTRLQPRIQKLSYAGIKRVICEGDIKLIEGHLLMILVNVVQKF